MPYAGASQRVPGPYPDPISEQSRTRLLASAELWNVKIFNGAVDKCSLKEVRVG